MWRERKKSSKRVQCGEPVCFRTANTPESAVNRNFTREFLALEVDTSLASQRVTRILDGVIECRGVPKALRMDNGPELTSRHFLAWCTERKIATHYIQPGKPIAERPYRKLQRTIL